ncbi:MAG: hypothetical protein HYS27_19870 [Deltaproteobacteria bacterium]|nr:hypothetical protein [Deltaproteobacteria bacterium]
MTTLTTPRKHPRQLGRRRLLLLAALASSLSLAMNCTCGEPPGPNPGDAVGQLSAYPVDGGFELVLSGLERPVRSLQVDVALAGAQATGASALGGSDVLEAGLATPKNDFTVVVADTRRLNLQSGAVVRVDTDAAPSTIELSRAFAVDDTGAMRTVLVVVP